MTKKEGTRTSHGEPIGTSREEESLKEKGFLPENRILQRTQDGYEETDVKDIPLSEQAGEGRVDREADEK